VRLKHLASFYLQTVFTNSVSELGTESNGWDRFNYANNFDVGLHTVHDNVDRIDSRFVSVEEFQQKYEKTYTPVVIVNDQLDWPATKKWFTNVSICCIHKNTIFLQNMNIGPHKFKGTYKNQFHKVYVIYN
jgi:hypothetical protein